MLFHSFGRRSDLALVDFGGESQGVEGLSKIFLPRRNVDEHQRLGVAAQRTLEQVSELGVAVGNVRILNWGKKEN